ncbi:MAG: HD domain-containing protein [Propionibacteriaceae bacterium]|jgi:hypothetical protein|nr:HD domain-containing protein [Propionibacteriaceae bacterium]
MLNHMDDDFDEAMHLTVYSDTLGYRRAYRKEQPMVPPATLIALAVAEGWLPHFHASGAFSFDRPVALGSVTVMAYDILLHTGESLRFVPSCSEWLYANHALEQYTHKAVDELRETIAAGEALNARLTERAGRDWAALKAKNDSSPDGRESEIARQLYGSVGSVRDVLMTALREYLGQSDDGLRQAARLLTHVAHQGQVDKAGNVYVHHPRHVASNVSDAGGPPEAVAAGWLHDTVEDTWVTPEFLAEAGFPASVISAVDAVTKREGEPIDGYVRRIAADPLAVMVKRADLADNTDPERLVKLEPTMRARLEAKYAAFAGALDEVL